MRVIFLVCFLSSISFATKPPPSIFPPRPGEEEKNLPEPASQPAGWVRLEDGDVPEEEESQQWLDVERITPNAPATNPALTTTATTEQPRRPPSPDPDEPDEIEVPWRRQTYFLAFMLGVGLLVNGKFFGQPWWRR